MDKTHEVLVEHARAFLISELSYGDLQLDPFFGPTELLQRHTNLVSSSAERLLYCEPLAQAFVQAHEHGSTIPFDPRNLV